MKSTYALKIGLVGLTLATIASADQVVVIEEGLTEAQANKWRKARGQSVVPVFNEDRRAYEVDSYTAPSIKNDHAFSISDTSLYAALSAGYLFDTSEPYFVAQLGYKFKNGLGVFLQGLWTDDDQSEGGVTIDAGITSLSIGLSYLVDSGGAWAYSFGGSAGISNLDVDVNVNRFDDDSYGTYFDLFAQAEYRITSHLSGHLGVRAIFLDDFDLELGPVDSSSDVGIEAGLTYRF